MRNPSLLVGLALVVGALSPFLATAADDSSNLYYDFTLSLELSQLDNLSLGDDPALDRLVTEDYELEVDLEYKISDPVYLFLSASLIDETETVKPLRQREAVSGLERKQIGVAVGFGDVINSELKIGRREFYDASEWWVWWDEELDAISVESNYRRFSGMLAVAEEQARDSTGVDFIDPEQDGVRRVLGSFYWAFAESQALVFYYLDQRDRSSAYRPGAIEELERIDETDADLSWSGMSYLGEFESESLGEFGVEWHYSRVSGDETRYEFDDEEGAVAELDETETVDIAASAQAYWLGWTPAALDDWRFIVAAARASGDRDPDDNRDESFQQNGLQGDSEVYGELYLPELSNLSIRALGVAWQVYPGIGITLLGFDYEQRRARDEMRSVGIELDPNGVDRELGTEIDLVVSIETVDNLELTIIAAEFEAGAAYGARAGERSRYLSVELDYSF